MRGSVFSAAVVVAGVQHRRSGGVAVVAGDGALAARRVDPEPAPEQPDRRVVVEAEVHRGQQVAGLAAQLGHGVAHHQQGGGHPAVVDRGQERVHRAAVHRPGGQLGPGGRVVPVVEHAAGLVALQPGHAGQGGGDPPAGLGRGDDAGVAGGQGAPQVGADVGRGGVAAALPGGADVVRRQPGARVDQQLERPPGVGGVALQHPPVTGAGGGRALPGGRRGQGKGQGESQQDGEDGEAAVRHGPGSSRADGDGSDGGWTVVAARGR